MVTADRTRSDLSVTTGFNICRVLRGRVGRRAREGGGGSEGSESGGAEDYRGISLVRTPPSV